MSDTDKAMNSVAPYLDPNYKYTWGAEEPRSRIEMKLDGFVDVDVKTTDPKLADHPLVSPDGKIRLGDAVLMRTSREEWEKSDKDRVKRANEWVSKVREEYKSEGARLGIQAYEDSTP